MSPTYLSDIKKGAMYSNRSMLKEFGFHWDQDKKKWYSDDPVDDATRSALEAVGIFADDGTLVRGLTAIADAVSKLGTTHLVANDHVAIVAVNEGTGFNSGAYLHSRAKNNKPLDPWFIEKKCVPGTFFESMYPGATTVIQMVQTIGMNGQPIKPVLWIFVCNASGNVLARLKASEHVDKDKRVES